MANKGKCSGCSFEDTPRRVQVHHRSCVGFAELYRQDPELALLDPGVVYVQHVAVSADVSAAPSSDDLLTSRPRKARATKAAGGVSSARAPGPVTVEYWDWHPTILEELQSHVNSS